MITFVVSILSFVWRTGAVDDPDERSPLGRHAILGPRIAITAVFVLGMIYFALIVRTLKSYGSHWVLKGRRQVTVEHTQVPVEPDIGTAQDGGRGRETNRERRSDEPASNAAMMMTDSPEKGNVKLNVDISELEVNGARDREGRMRSLFGLSRENSRQEGDPERGLGSASAGQSQAPSTES